MLGRGQTGSGKTLAFGLAMLTRLAGRRAKPHQPLGLVLAPTREMAMQPDFPRQPRLCSQKNVRKMFAIPAMTGRIHGAASGI